MVTTKQMIAKITNDLMRKSSLTDKPDLMALNKFSNAVMDVFLKQFKGDPVVLEGLVAMSYAVANFVAVGIVSTVKTKEELKIQISMINEVLTATVRQSLESAWSHANEPKKNDALIVTMPN